MLSNPSTRSNPPPPPSSPPINSNRTCHCRESRAFGSLTLPRQDVWHEASTHTSLRLPITPPPPQRIAPAPISNRAVATIHTLSNTLSRIHRILPWSASTIGSHHHHIIIIACCQGNAHCFRWEALEGARPGCEGVSVDCGHLGQTFGAWPS